MNTVSWVCAEPRSDPQRFGVRALDGERIVRIDEKPERPASGYAVTGVYIDDRRVFDFIRRLRPSGRGDLEITDVNNFYIREGDLCCDLLEGWWTDAGTFESLFAAGKLIEEQRRAGRYEPALV